MEKKNTQESRFVKILEWLGVKRHPFGGSQGNGWITGFFQQLSGLCLGPYDPLGVTGEKVYYRGRCKLHDYVH